MKNKIITIFVTIAIALTAGCSLYVSEDSYARAARGDFTLSYAGFEASKDSLHQKTLRALQDRGWTIESDGLPIKAKLHQLRQSACASFEISNNTISVNTKGSLVDNETPYVPKRYVDNVMASVRKYIDREKR